MPTLAAVDEEQATRNPIKCVWRWRWRRTRPAKATTGWAFPRRRPSVLVDEGILSPRKDRNVAGNVFAPRRAAGSTAQGLLADRAARVRAVHRVVPRPDQH